jgi:hypothetical protein
MSPPERDTHRAGEERQTRASAAQVSVLVANQPVALRRISRTGFVVYTPASCSTGRVAYCSFRVSSTLTVTLRARCVACGAADRYGTRLSRFEFIEDDTDASSILGSALEAMR